MPHIHTEPGEHDHTVSAFIVRIEDATPKILLHHHKLLGVLLQPGGHVELNETPWQALTHEIEEETGYDINELDILQPPLRIDGGGDAVIHPTPLVYSTHRFSDKGNHFHTDASYGFVAHALPTKAPAEGESSSLQWLSLEEMNQLSSNEIIENVRHIARFVLTKALEQSERIPASRFN